MVLHFTIAMLLVLGRVIHVHVGYAQDEIVRKGPRLGKGLPGIDILRKPFQLTDLADRVIEALAADA